MLKVEIQPNFVQRVFINETESKFLEIKESLQSYVSGLSYWDKDDETIVVEANGPHDLIQIGRILEKFQIKNF